MALASAVHNNRRNATTDLSPNQILLGYEPGLIPTKTSVSSNKTAQKWVELLLEKRTQAIDAINKTAKAGQTIPPQFHLGDQVWLEATHLKLWHQKTKLALKWYGPFQIIEEISPVAYQIELLVTWNIHNVFHASLLSAYQEMTAHGPNFSQPLSDLINGEEEYKVEYMVNHRHYEWARKLQYLIKWKGYPKSNNTWEPADQVHAPDQIKEYHRHFPLQDKKADQALIQAILQLPPITLKSSCLATKSFKSPSASTQPPYLLQPNPTTVLSVQPHLHESTTWIPISRHMTKKQQDSSLVKYVERDLPTKMTNNAITRPCMVCPQQYHPLLQQQQPQMCRIYLPTRGPQIRLRMAFNLSQVWWNWPTPGGKRSISVWAQMECGLKNHAFSAPPLMNPLPLPLSSPPSEPAQQTIPSAICPIREDHPYQTNTISTPFLWLRMPLWPLCLMSTSFLSHDCPASSLKLGPPVS